MDRILARSGCVCLHGRRTRRRWRVPNRRRSCCPGRRPQTRRPGTTPPTLRPLAGAGAASRAAAGGVRGRRAPSPPSRAQRSRFLVGRRGSWHRGGEGSSAPPSSPLGEGPRAGGCLPAAAAGVPTAGPRRRRPPPRSLDRSNKCYLFGSKLLRIEKEVIFGRLGEREENCTTL